LNGCVQLSAQLHNLSLLCGANVLVLGELFLNGDALGPELLSVELVNICLRLCDVLLTSLANILVQFLALVSIGVILKWPDGLSRMGSCLHLVLQCLGFDELLVPLALLDGRHVHGLIDVDLGGLSELLATIESLGQSLTTERCTGVSVPDIGCSEWG
jgi:hypothetical protein